MTDFKELREARWYCVNKIGMATVCTSKDDAADVAANCFAVYPVHAPYRVVQLVPIDDLRGLLERLDALQEFYDADRATNKVCDEVSPGLSSIPDGHMDRMGAAVSRRSAAVAKIKAMEQPE